MKHHYFFVLIAYFSISWFVPWYKIPTEISLSYVFDFAFIVTLIYWLKSKLFFAPKMDRHFFLSLLQTVSLAFFSILIVGGVNLATPFHLVENVMWHLLLFAPILEEFLFRVVFFQLAKTNYSKNKATLITSASFAFSHLPALWFLPQVFHPFIYVQLAYTFILGFILSREYAKSQSIVNVVILHLIFNLIFYISLKTQII
jgi:membrane protease YdiL (CAAX protease family)